jgi:hypothetical protein
MINQVKVQLNLYTHREKDFSIIKRFGLDELNNPNDKVREVLYNLSIDKAEVQPTNNNHLIDELNKQIELLKKDNMQLSIENKLLKDITSNNKANNEISATKIEEKSEKTLEKQDETVKNKINNKLLASVKQMNL